jgi:hypothetical protein
MGGVARCPFCGADVEGPTLAAPPPVFDPPPLVPPQPAESPPLVPPAARVSVRPRLEPLAKKQPNWVVPAAAGGILAAGALAIAFLGHRGEPPGAPPATSTRPAISPPPAESAPSRADTLADPAHADASDLYPKVKQRAVAWNADARLVSMAASPVVGDKVDLTRPDGEIVYVFVADPSARTPPFGRFAVTVRRGGIEQSTSPEPAKTAPANARAAATTLKVVEPNCVFDAAAKAAHASGVPASTVMKLRYEADPSSKRGVWTARVAGRSDLDRVIDGQTCAVVVRPSR